MGKESTLWPIKWTVWSLDEVGALHVNEKSMDENSGGYYYVMAVINDFALMPWYWKNKKIPVLKILQLNFHFFLGQK